MEEVLNNDKTDFGKESSPTSSSRGKSAHSYSMGSGGHRNDQSVLRDEPRPGSINPAFNFYDEQMPIYTHRRHLPATKVNFCNISCSHSFRRLDHTNAYIVNSIIGVRTLIESGASLDGVYCMGASHYETEEVESGKRAKGHSEHRHRKMERFIRKAIIDQNARIGDGCRIGIDDIPRKEGDFEMYSIHDGIIVINKNAIIANGTVM
jgi:glucose-1-phosphate adenylyltransferase